MTDVPIVRVNTEASANSSAMRWGLVPRWAKDPSIGDKMINARGETIAEKPSFRMAYRRHRCLLARRRLLRVDASARRRSAPRKQPVHIGMKDGALFALAGCSSAGAASPRAKSLDTCTIVTTRPTSLLRPSTTGCR